jgi:hypothetical protein
MGNSTTYSSQQKHNAGFNLISDKAVLQKFITKIVRQKHNGKGKASERHTRKLEETCEPKEHSKDWIERSENKVSKNLRILLGNMYTNCFIQARSY